MCTVTIVPFGDSTRGFRMACNRDESHDRAPAYPPIKSEADGVRYIMPVDPISRGTWVAVNEHGLALTVLNYNLPDPPTGRDKSRGDVIPSLLSATTIKEVVSRLSSIDRERMMPFRLVGCDGESVMLWRSTEPAEKVEISVWDDEPVMWTSSGLGDHLVEQPRREVFDTLFGENIPLSFAEYQHEFHCHQWPDQQHLSVCMHREDARTVSYTTVEVSDAHIKLAYHADRPDRDAEDRWEDFNRRLVQR